MDPGTFMNKDVTVKNRNDKDTSTVLEEDVKAGRPPFLRQHGEYQGGTQSRHIETIEGNEAQDTEEEMCAYKSNMMRANEGSSTNK